MIVLGGALVWTTSHLLQQQALTEAARTAEAYVASGVEREVPESAFSTGTFPPALVGRLDSAFMPRRGSTLMGVRLWTGDGVVVYDSSDRGPGGRGSSGASTRSAPDDVAAGAIPDPLRFQDAISRVGAVASAAVVTEVDATGHSRQRLDVYVPVTYDRAAPERGRRDRALLHRDRGRRPLRRPDHPLRHGGRARAAVAAAVPDGLERQPHAAPAGVRDRAPRAARPAHRPAQPTAAQRTARPGRRGQRPQRRLRRA